MFSHEDSIERKIHTAAVALLMPALHWLLASLLLTAAATHPPRAPRFQSAAQIAYVAEAARHAAVASNAARPALLTYLDSVTFRSTISQCCPSIALESAASLLSRIEHEIRVAELTHNFHSNEQVQNDLNVSVGASLSWFPNQWDLQVLNLLDYRMNASDFAVKVMLAGEHNVYQTSNFSSVPPTSLKEALDRPTYAALNAMRLDSGGSPHFGAACAVFNRSAIGATVVIAAADSGLYEFSCYKPLSKRNTWEHLDVNCSAWNTSSLPLGTLDHFLHLLLPSNAYWGTAIEANGSGIGDGPSNALLPIEMMFARWYGDSEDDALITEAQWFSYFESNIFASPLYEEARGGISYMVASFVSLFGNQNGTALREWCISRGWLLIWALGDGAAGPRMPNSPFNSSLPWNARIVDPSVAAATSRRHNVSVSADSLAVFEATWSEAQAAAAPRAAVAVYKRWWTTLISCQRRELTANAMKASSCADQSHRCIATNAVDDGLCYHF